MDFVIKTINLSKQFKRTHVLKPVNLEIEKGEICALIGRNGAGKSTLFKLISNQLKPTTGSVTVLGKSIHGKNQILQRVGFMIETPQFIQHFSAYQNLKYFSIQCGISDDKYINQALKTVGLFGIEKKVGAYSLGMKQRLGIARALINNPDVLILDEPINGLDVQGIRDFRDCILKLNREQGMTIVISSHILSELQQIATRFIFIERGEIVEDISKSALMRKGEKQLVVRVNNVFKASKILEEQIDEVMYKVIDDYTIVVTHPSIDSSALNHMLFENGIAVEEIRVETASVESYFLNMYRGESND